LLLHPPQRQILRGVIQVADALLHVIQVAVIRVRCFGRELLKLVVHHAEMHVGFLGEP
jgi:hypothetical protein